MDCTSNPLTDALQRLEERNRPLHEGDHDLTIVAAQLVGSILRVGFALPSDLTHERVTRKLLVDPDAADAFKAERDLGLTLDLVIAAGIPTGAFSTFSELPHLLHGRTVRVTISHWQNDQGHTRAGIDGFAAIVDPGTDVDSTVTIPASEPEQADATRVPLDACDDVPVDMDEDDDPSIPF